MLQHSRRAFFTGLGASVIAAPAIVRASSLMKLPPPWWYRRRTWRSWVTVGDIVDRNMLLSREYDLLSNPPLVMDSYRNIPLRVVDKLKPNESRCPWYLV